jgi:hypothetical protein
MYTLLVRKPEGRRPLRKARHRWEDNAELDPKVTGCESGDWINLTQDRDQWLAVVSAVMNLWVP